MSLRAVLITVVMLGVAMPVESTAADCRGEARAAVDAAQADVDRGEMSAAAERLRAVYQLAADCPELAIAVWSLRGWLAAQAARPAGGTPESLAEVTAAVDTLGTLGPAVSPAAYAAAQLRAAAAAAQDERDEMAVWMEHARDLARRLGDGGAPPRWPLPLEQADAELWYAVDDFERAETAFTHAVAARDSAAGWRGLARTRDRRANARGACQAYRRVLDRPVDPASEALAAEARGYLLLCPP